MNDEQATAIMRRCPRLVQRQTRMNGIFYAVVDSDPLTSGKGSRVMASVDCCHIEGEDGIRRRMVFIGDKAYCSACNSIGVIVGGAAVDPLHRLLDMVNGNRRQAVSEDRVACKCPQQPRIIAVYGRSWSIQETDNNLSHIPTPEALAEHLNYDEKFTLIDANGTPLIDTYYSIRMPSGEIKHGITDAQGQTARHNTNGAQPIRIYLGHR